MGHSELPAAYSEPRDHVRSTTDIDQMIVSIQTLYIVSLCTIKLSILLFYNRIFGVPRPMFRYILLATGAVVIAYSVAGMLGTILQCVPLSDLWYVHFGACPPCLALRGSCKHVSGARGGPLHLPSPVLQLRSLLEQASLTPKYA